MSSNLSLCPDSTVRELCRAAGACAVGFAAAGAVDSSHVNVYSRWISAGCHGDMSYLARYMDVRADVCRLLPGAATVISLAFPYRPAGGYHHPLIADYAIGKDYHRVLKARLTPVVEQLASRFGALSRVCVDTAPVLERYWAVRAGIGFIGRNRQLTVPGVGSGVFLAEVITTLRLFPDSLCTLGCGDCMACVRACPTGALGRCSFDSVKCRSYTTIESREPLLFALPFGDRVYGCDICAHVCPHNLCEPPEPLPEFCLDSRLLGIDRASLANVSSGDFRRLFRESAISRVNWRKMRDNAKY